MELTDKYRPKTFEEVLGQDAIVASLKALIEKENRLPSCLLFTGDPGLGKTSLARVAAAVVGCNNIIEINGANHTGIDDMREIIDQMNFKAFGPNKSKVVIIDECQRLSKQAWDSLLKPTEEPNGSNSWILCSTEPTKIPKSITSRCVPPSGYQLKKVDNSKIKGLLTSVITAEKFTLNPSIVTLITMNCNGSPRQALKYLESLQDEKDVNNAKEIIKSINISDTPPIINLCRLLVNKCPWEQAVEAVKDMEDDNNGIRYGVVNYIAKCVIGSKSMEHTKYLLGILHAFKDPFDPAEKLGPVLLALATVLID